MRLPRGRVSVGACAGLAAAAARTAADAQRIQHDAQRAHRHAQRRQPRRNEAERRQRHGGQVVVQRPALVLAHDRRASRARGRARVGDRVETAAFEHDVAARLCQLGAFGERDRDVRAGEHRSIVDAVTDGEHARAAGAKLREPGEFVGRQQRARATRRHSVARRCRDLRRRIAARDEHRHALRLQRARSRRRLRAAGARPGERPRSARRRRRAPRRPRSRASSGLPSAARNRCGPRRSARPAMRALTPSRHRVARRDTSAAARPGMPRQRSRAPAGWRLWRASVAASASAVARQSVERPYVGTATGWARSACRSCRTATCVHPASASIASGFTTSTPRRASSAERARERGGNRERERAGAGHHQHRDAAANARAGSIKLQPMAVSAVSASTRATKRPAARSPATLQARAFASARAPTSAAIPASAVSAPTRSTRRITGPIARARCRRSARRRGASSRGADSPLSSASSTRQCSLSQHAVGRHDACLRRRARGRRHAARGCRRACSVPSRRSDRRTAASAAPAHR